MVGSGNIIAPFPDMSDPVHTHIQGPGSGVGVKSSQRRLFRADSVQYIHAGNVDTVEKLWSVFLGGHCAT